MTEYTNTARTTSDSASEGRLKADVVGGKKRIKHKMKYHLLSELNKYHSR